MGIPIAELQERISSREFAEYWAHFALEPWGPEREDLRAGIVAATVANTSRDPKKRRQPYTPDQFVPKVETEDTDDGDEMELEDEAAAHASRIDELMASLGGPDEAETIVRRRE